ncbi:MAG: tetratricopeptide repeat protein [Bacteroidota bacterium]|nr:tetratricopeptide repeat protein [Bacteroidota bacterium]
MKAIFSLFVITAVLFAACSSGSDSGELMSKARGLEEDEQPADALLLYEQIGRDYPDAPEVPEALFRSAALYYNHEKDILKAATTYELVCDRFPQSEYGHRGLFFAAFTYANELGNLERARVAYTKYLEEYPDSSMAETARFELENLGKSPEELLQSLQESTPPLADQ